LQDLAGGEHGAHTQKLLNEVAAARRCLLNPATKADYDQTLRAFQVPMPVAIPVPVELSDATIADSPAFSAPPIAPKVVATAARSPKFVETAAFAGFDLSSPAAPPPAVEKKRSSPRIEPKEEAPKPGRKLWYIGGGVALLALVGGVLALTRGGSS